MSRKTKYVQAPAEPKRGLGPTSVHEESCFIVTTRWANLPWQPCSGPATCGFCIKREGQGG